MNIQSVILVLIPMILALSVHEYAHAAAAKYLGDDTAHLAGRLTLNPLAHIDLFGSLLIPILGLMGGIPFFGWAKPVPVNPTRFRRSVNMRNGLILVSAAGPLSNVAMALLAGIGYGLSLRFQLQPVFNEFLLMFMMINVGLAIFNLLPIPPLDGSRIAESLAPRRFEPAILFMHRYSWVFFMMFLFFGGRAIAPIFNGVISFIITFISGVFA